MSIIKGTEKIVNPLQESQLNKKGLCDYVINIASGCLHGCTFCYVPSTPAIRVKQLELQEKGVSNPQMDWGKYLFIREEIPEQLDKILNRKKAWRTTTEGKGVVLLCSGTDPYQNKETAALTRKVVQILLNHEKRIRILTRSPLWLEDLDILSHKNVTVGMSLPHLDNELSRQIEPSSPPPTSRYQALLKGAQNNVRLYVALAPTPPHMQLNDFKQHLEKVMRFNPEVIFWEPINARGSNGKRMLAAGLDFVEGVMTKKLWAECFTRQWHDIELAAEEVGCLDRLHVWVDPQLKGFVEDKKLNKWLYKPTPEKWSKMKDFRSKNEFTSVKA